MVFENYGGVKCPIFKFDDENQTTTIVEEEKCFSPGLLLSSPLWLTRQRQENVNLIATTIDIIQFFSLKYKTKYHIP